MKYFSLIIIFVCLSRCCFAATDSIPAHRNDTIRHALHIASLPKKIDTAGLHQNEIPPFIFDKLFSSQLNSPIAVTDFQETRTAHHDLFLPLLLLLVLIYVAWIRQAYARELNENMTVLFNSGLAQQIYRDREFSLNLFTSLTFINFSIVTGVFLFLAGTAFHIHFPFNSPTPDILFCIGTILAVYLLKSIAYRIAAGIYKLGSELFFFRFNALVIYQVTGIVLLPFVIVAAFARPPVNMWAIDACIVVLSAAALVRLFKGLAVAGPFIRFHFVYFLLYICAFEIAPAAVLLKVFISRI